MAKIDYIHRDMIEDLFEMRGGYVLNFNNDDFEAFIEEILRYKGIRRYLRPHSLRNKI